MVIFLLRVERGNQHNPLYLPSVDIDPGNIASVLQCALSVQVLGCAQAPAGYPNIENERGRLRFLAVA
jgi:hypothetical protein